MEDEAACSFCERPAEDRCRRCGRPYCSNHGGAFCSACLTPASALPSGRLVRAAALVFAVCVLLGVWFLVANPRIPGEAAHVDSGRRETADSSAVQPVASATAAATVSPTATASATPAIARDYTVQANDTLASIAAAAGVTPAAIQQVNPSIDPSNLQIGQTIHIPANPP